MKEEIHIHVNDNKVTLEKNSLLGKEIKQSSSVPGSDSLYVELANDPDIEILNDSTYEMNNGMKLFTGQFPQKIEVTVNHNKYDLQKSDCTGLEVKRKVGIPDADKLVKETKDGDVQIQDNITYHFEKNDSLFSVPSGIDNGSEGTDLLPFDKEILDDGGYNYEVRPFVDNENNEKIVIIKDYPLSPMFDQEKVKVLIKIPKGYPASHLDMFWVNPSVKLKATNNYPQNADQIQPIEGEQWQRFSRHYPWKTTYNLGTHLSVIKEVLVNGRG